MTTTAVRYLADVSVFAHSRIAAVTAVIEPLMIQRGLATCGVLELQVLGSLRNPVDHPMLARHRRAALAWVSTEDSDLHRALDLQAALTDRAEHTTPWPKLVTAAVAERHQLVLLHHDPDFARIAKLTGQPTECVVPEPPEGPEEAFRRVMHGATDQLWALGAHHEGLAALHDVLDEARQRDESGREQHEHP
jgi:predicted nucleic acid-binding protein